MDSQYSKTQIEFSPYLTKEEGLEAVYKYAEYYQEPITNETALQINELCMSDPFFIYSVIQSEYDDKDLTNSDSVIDTVDYEVSDSRAEMCLTWSEYIDDTLDKVNDNYAKKMLLHLNKYSDRYWQDAIEDFQEKLHQLQTDKILAAFLSLGGFTSKALQKCHQYGIANSDQINQF